MNLWMLHKKKDQLLKKREDTHKMAESNKAFAHLGGKLCQELTI